MPTKPTAIGFCQCAHTDVPTQIHTEIRSGNHKESHIVAVKVVEPSCDVQRNAPPPLVPPEVTPAVVLDLVQKVSPDHVLHDQQCAISLHGSSQEPA